MFEIVAFEENLPIYRIDSMFYTFQLLIFLIKTLITSLWSAYFPFTHLKLSLVIHTEVPLLSYPSNNLSTLV